MVTRGRDGGRASWAWSASEIFVAALAILSRISEDPAYAPKKGEWSAYGGGQSAQRYSELAQITPVNVKDLKRVWTFNTGDIPKKYGSELTPLKVGNAIYGCTPMNKLFALNAATGEKLWMTTPRSRPHGRRTPRRVAVWHSTATPTPLPAKPARNASSRERSTCA